jgi:hypothetical protein
LGKGVKEPGLLSLQQPGILGITVTQV